MILLPLWIWFLFFWTTNDSVVILVTHFDEIILIFFYMMENFLQLHSNNSYIFYKYMFTIHFFCFHDACFVLYMEVSSSSNFVYDCSNPNLLYNSFIIYISDYHDFPRLFQRQTSHWWEFFIKGLCKGVMWYSKFLKNISIGSLDHNHLFQNLQISHLVYDWHWNNGKHRWYLNHLNIC